MKQVRLPLDSPEVVAMKKKYGRPKQQNQKRERENHGEVVAVLRKKQRPCDVGVLYSICVMYFEEEKKAFKSHMKLLFRKSLVIIF